MAILEIKKLHTWPCIRELNNFLIRERDNTHSTLLRMGINHAIIFYSACFFEGVMESGLKALLRRRREIYNKIDMPEFEVRKTTNLLFNALEEDLEMRISRATGVAGYDDLFKLITGEKISQNDSVKPMWEGACILFQFRNVLAHGREISASRLSAYWIDRPWLDQFSGGYKQAENYLVKLKLIEQGFWDSKSSNLYFTDVVADHFWHLAQELIDAIIISLSIDDRKTFEEALAIDEIAKNDEETEQPDAQDDHSAGIP